VIAVPCQDLPVVSPGLDAARSALCHAGVHRSAVSILRNKDRMQINIRNGFSAVAGRRRQDSHHRAKFRGKRQTGINGQAHDFNRRSFDSSNGCSGFRSTFRTIHLVLVLRPWPMWISVAGEV
jgi:hypothetical protein